MRALPTVSLENNYQISYTCLLADETILSEDWILYSGGAPTPCGRDTFETHVQAVIWRQSDRDPK